MNAPQRIERADVVAMFEGVDDATREIVVRRLRNKFTAAIQGVNNGPPGVITPPTNLIMSPFRLCPSAIWRGVIIGQDPFPTAGRAHGLAFSTLDGSVQPSTRNMYACLRARGLMTGDAADRLDHGDLTKWTRQGVLMINTSMTTLVGKSNAHTAAWSEYTDALITAIASIGRPLFFILLGMFAQSKTELITATRGGHSILKWGHPSPLSTANARPGPTNFVHADVFDRANDFLIDRGDVPIDWDVRAPLPDDYVAPKPIEGITGRGIGFGRNYADSSLDGFVDAVDAPPLPVVEALPPARWNEMRDCVDDDPKPVALGCGDDPFSTLYIFTDGGALANGKPECRASWGFFATNGAVCVEIYGNVEARENAPPSNQRAELEAIYRALEFARAHIDDIMPRHVVLISDSEYSLKCVNEWINAWTANPSRLIGKKNLDLIYAAKAELDALEAECVVTFAHARGHCAEPALDTLAWFVWRGNAIADSLCGYALGSTDKPAVKRLVAANPVVYKRAGRA